MAKKRSPRQKRTPMVRPVQSEAVPGPVATPAPSATDIRTEYRYVITDLKRIGVTAAVMFALLVVLALIIT